MGRLVFAILVSAAKGHGHSVDVPHATTDAHAIGAALCDRRRDPGRRDSVFADNAPGSQFAPDSLRWREPDSNLYGAFPVK
jgi:hypothetical protein